MKKDVYIKIITDKSESDLSLFDEFENDELEYGDIRAEVGEDNGEEIEHLEMTSAGTFEYSDGRITISYEESELTGMDGSHTSLTFTEDEPELVTMLRDGTVKTALIFEPDKRHISAYQTPFMPFEICILTKSLDNRLLSDGILIIDYTVEIKGAAAEHNIMQFSIKF